MICNLRLKGTSQEEGLQSHPACPPSPRPGSAPVGVDAENTGLDSCICTVHVYFEFLSSFQGLGFMLLALLSHLCLLALWGLKKGS